MTKKRIADLLKEEVEKTDQAEQDPAQSKTQEAASASSETSETTAKSSGSTGRTRKRSSKPTSATKTTTTATKKASTTSDTASLEKKITELEASLSQAEEQIVGLQEDLETHQSRIFELKDELAASQKATADKTIELSKVSEELETAKETIRKITAAQTNKAESPEQPQPKVIHGADLATNRNTLSLRNRPSSYKAIPEYAIQRGEQNSMLSDDDIGWVD